ncbi:shikimate dehydrogenase [Ruminococcaceae bacterium OttesenSCG-928-A16]|nr:shikimate dehydrogenase [Ruminococcaceae bacterium OttesenSCG-928-A16]
MQTPEKRYELIGTPLAQSFSKPIHEALGAYAFHLHELPNEAAVAEYLTRKEFGGCNVTIPYKQTVMPFCNAIDERAARIGAVNTIVNNNGKLTGYNTDYDGFALMLERKNIRLGGKKVLLLGGGATSKTVTAVAQDAGATEIKIAARNPQNGQLSFEEAMQRGDFEVIVNVTPVGMYPHNGETLVDLTRFNNLTAVADVIYNPLKTRLILDAEALGIPTAGGLPMLVGQAVGSARLYTGLPFGPQKVERVLAQTAQRFANILLIGMPSSGKSKLGKAVAKKLHKEFLDLDTALVQKAGKPIPQIFAEDGEAYFRQLETEVLAEETKLPGRVLSTGGGVVTQSRNLPLLHQNGVVVFINRPLALLQTGKGRPLSSSPAALETMAKQRLPLYRQAANIEVENNAPFMQVVHKILEETNEFFDY